MVKIGLNPDHLTGWRKKWKGLKQTSGNRGSDFLLSFEDYVTIAVDSGLTHYDQVGRRSGQHGMARIGDTGPYVYGNCRFLTTEENIAERCLNGGTARQAEKMSRKFEAIDPSGVVHIGTNLSEFTRLNGLSADYLGKVARGIHVSKFGWKCRFIEEEE